MLALNGAAAMTSHAQAQCVEQWSAIGQGVGDSMYAFHGHNGVLYAGGGFQSAGEVSAVHVAKFDGSVWSAVGTGINGTVFSLTSFGSDLIAGGTFTAAGGNAANRIARWNGTTWTALGDGVDNIDGSASVTALIVFNGELYVGGNFTSAGGQPAIDIARWNGATWSPVGSGIPNDGQVFDLAVYDDGSGPALYAGGGFGNVVNGETPYGLAKWNGSTWTAISGCPTGVRALAAFNGELYIGGTLGFADAITRWNGAAFSSVGTGISLNGVFPATVEDLQVLDDGSGPALYAGGWFSTAGGNSAVGVAKWNGSTWSNLGGGVSGIAYTLAGFSNSLYVGGAFNVVDGNYAYNAARWACDFSGSCCLPNGTCDVRTEFLCSSSGGTYNGNDTFCGSVTCPPAATGACCASTACTIATKDDCVASRGTWLGANTPCSGNPCSHYHFEVEPNQSKAEATAVTLPAGDFITGLSMSSTADLDPFGQDLFLIQTTPAAPAIYLHRMILINGTTPGNVAQLYGNGQTPASPLGPWPGAVGSSNDVTTGMQNGPLTNGQAISSWYGFGKQERVYYAAQGTSATTGPYRASLSTTVVTPTNLGYFEPGQIVISTFGQGHTNNTHIRVFDSSYNPVPGFANDGASTNGGAPANSTTTSYLNRTYPAGTYYLAVAGGIITNQGAACDDNTQSGLIADFANIVIERGLPVTNENISFSVTDQFGTVSIPATRGGPGRIAWYTFTVAPRGVCCMPNGTCTVVNGAANCSGTFNANSVTCAPPALAFALSTGSPVSVSDSTGNGNNNSVAEPGENSLHLTIPIVNSRLGFGCGFAAGDASASGISATLSSLTPTATVVGSVATFPDMISGATASNTSPFVLSLASDHPCGKAVKLRLTVSDNSGVPPLSIDFSIDTGYNPVASTFTWSGPAAVIVDNTPAGTNAILSISGLPTSLSDVNVRFDSPSGTCSGSNGSANAGLTHNNIGDVRITLTSPSGTSVVLLDQLGGSNNHICGTVFDDEAAPGLFPGLLTQPHTGSFRPIGSLSVLDGEDPNGTWTLNVADVVGNAIPGTLRRFSIVVSTNTCDAAGVSCPADFNTDGARDVADLFAYINAWLAKTPSADFNHDTAVNVADLFAYINAWLAGC